MLKSFLFLIFPILLVSCSDSTPIIPQVSKNIESATFGAPSSKAQLIIFADYQCPACIRFEKNI